MIKLIVMIGITFCVLIAVSFAENNKIHHPFVDKHIGGVLVSEDSIKKVIQLYGQGFSQRDFHGETLCYFDAQKQIYFNLSFHDGILESVILSKIRNQEIAKECRKKPIKSKGLATGRNIQLGDSQNKIIQIYGEPEKRGIKEGMLVFEYHTDYEKDTQATLFYDAYLYFKEGRLIKIVIHDGE